MMKSPNAQPCLFYPLWDHLAFKTTLKDGLSRNIPLHQWPSNFRPVGQLIAQDIVSATQPSCPVELLRVPVPLNDTEFRFNTTMMPFMRSDYDLHTGQSPNRPRRQVKVSSLDQPWVDLDKSFLWIKTYIIINIMEADLKSC